MIPEYDEDLDEAFSGPFDRTTFDEEDETYDDAYEAQTAILFNDGVMAPPSGDGPTSTRGVGSDHLSRQEREAPLSIGFL